MLKYLPKYIQRELFKLGIRGHASMKQRDLKVWFHLLALLSEV